MLIEFSNKEVDQWFVLNSIQIYRGISEYIKSEVYLTQ
jgi:hypothetical protein